MDGETFRFVSNKNKVFFSQYSNFILGVCQFMKSITLFLVPALIGIFVTRADSVDQWKYLYVGTAVSLYLVCFKKISLLRPDCNPKMVISRPI